MRIGIIIGRIGGVDGVALETEKWIDVLERLGHEVFVISGDFEFWKMDQEHHDHFPLLSFFSPSVKWEQRKAFYEPDKDPGPVLDHINDIANIITEKLLHWVQGNKIEVLLSENASALPSHLAMGVAIKNLVQQTSLPIVTHDHDFLWERGNRYTALHDEVYTLINVPFP